MRDYLIGIDLGGTKIEGVLMSSADGVILKRLRLETPKNDYDGIIQRIGDIIQRLEPAANTASVGICTPGSVSPASGLIKNSNSVCLNGKPLHDNLEKTLGRPLRLANDANCLAVSEATDGAAAGMNSVFAVIIGTGAGGGIAIDGRVHNGHNAMAGEWGHLPLPWMTADEFPGPPCFCGKRGCCELYISGTGLERDYASGGGDPAHNAADIEQRAANGCALAESAVHRYENRLARGLAMVANLLDPEAIVLGGGMSKMLRLYQSLPTLMRGYISGGDFKTPVLQAKHGDSSGVRGAAWLWR